MVTCENTQNSTLHKGFHLLAFSSYEDARLVLSFGVLLMYLIAVLGNVIITALVCLAPQLHTPMYFFLCNLSIQDVMYVSSILPNLLAITMTGVTCISFQACITQVFVFVFSLDTEFFLLTSMAYDRYVAICIPLHYSILVNKRTCVQLAAASWTMGALNSLMYSILVSNLSFCGVQEINHFFCDVNTMLNLSCSDTSTIDIILFVEGVFLGLLPFLFILISYIYIIYNILKIHTSGQRLKIFSGCSSHLTVVILFYGTVLILYMKPKSENSQERDKLLSLLYVAVVPTLNPLVYSLRNREVIKAMNKIFEKITQT
ncbi:olfactory receptor 13F1-like [Mixophyes fleayi]|uniref:olfactory receptor 13F1-like n=1 Tax=Mixophyes fleayi TaxID=3061075 RepID=UPI003F4DBB37